MKTLAHNMQQRLLSRIKAHNERSLVQQSAGVDFLSNDYLGYATSLSLKKRIIAEFSKQSTIGSTGSRLLSGNHEYLVQLESDLADLFQAESGLLFTSGYSLNIGLLDAFTQRDDFLLLDENVHASLKNSLKLSSARGFFFRHNDCEHLYIKLKRLREKQTQPADIFVVVESLYSMDGDLAPLSKMVAVCEQFSAHLIVDEAHAMGTIGGDGKGLCCALGIEKRVFARVVTFGKAFGTSGALLLGSSLLMKYITNFCHSFIYTTGMSLLTAVSIKEAVTRFSSQSKELCSLKKNIQYFNKVFQVKNHESPIYGLVFSTIEELLSAAKELKYSGFLIQPIFSPTVSRGKEQLRLCLHSFNTQEEIECFAKTLRAYSYEI